MAAARNDRIDGGGCDIGAHDHAGAAAGGVSSTLRWRPMPLARMSWTSRVHSPSASALPISETPSGPGNISGNSVSTEARHIITASS